MTKSINHQLGTESTKYHLNNENC